MVLLDTIDIYTPKYDKPQKIRKIRNMIESNNFKILFSGKINYLNFSSTVVRGKKNIKKKILYITYDGLSDKLGHSQILPYILFLNKNKNYKFIIISFEKRIPSKELIDLINKQDIKWYRLRFTKKFFFIIKFFDLLKIIFPNVDINFYKIDLIHCRGHLPSISGLLAKFFFKKIYI